jgi:hypothetical protein
MAQQAMAEQAKRMADFMLCQIVLKGAVLIGLGNTIYYARQIARGIVLRQASLMDHPKPVQPQRAQGVHIDERGKVKL